MAEFSKIEWTDHTFNPWEGCTKVSAGCKHCYAEARANRFKSVTWGPTGQRRRTSAQYWKQPLLWNRKAKAAGKRARVFCASLADVFEDKPDQPEMDEWRFYLFDMIQHTPHLDWLLLTKRPENVNSIIEHVTGFGDAGMWLYSAPNVWIGTSVENQEQADKRIPELLNIPAKVRFLSMEPLLGPVLMDNGETSWLNCNGKCSDDDEAVCSSYEYTGQCFHGIDWVIVGGESGADARPMHPDWALGIRDQCVEAGVPFFFKQWGEWIHELQIRDDSLASGTKYMLWHCKPTPEDVGLMARRSHYRIHTNGGFDYYRVGKRAAGRLLDGREWEQFPEVHHED